MNITRNSREFCLRTYEAFLLKRLKKKKKLENLEIKLIDVCQRFRQLIDKRMTGKTEEENSYILINYKQRLDYIRIDRFSLGGSIRSGSHNRGRRSRRYLPTQWPQTGRRFGRWWRPRNQCGDSISSSWNPEGISTSTTLLASGSWRISPSSSSWSGQSQSHHPSLYFLSLSLKPALNFSLLNSITRYELLVYIQREEVVGDPFALLEADDSTSTFQINQKGKR